MKRICPLCGKLLWTMMNFLSMTTQMSCHLTHGVEIQSRFWSSSRRNLWMRCLAAVKRILDSRKEIAQSPQHIRSPASHLSQVLSKPILVCNSQSIRILTPLINLHPQI